MDSIELLHKQFLSALEADEPSTSTEGFIEGCRCRKCYQGQEATSRHSRCLTYNQTLDQISPWACRPIGERLPSLGRLFPGESSDFAAFFCGKIARDCDLSAGDQVELEDTVLVYNSDGVDSLYRDLEYAFLNFGWNRVGGLGKLFSALADHLTKGYIFRHFFAACASMKNRKWDVVFSGRYEYAVDPRIDLVRQVALSGSIGLLDEMIKFGATSFRPRPKRDSKYEMSKAEVAVLILLIARDEVLPTETFNYVKDRLKVIFEQSDSPEHISRQYVVLHAIQVLAKILNDPGQADLYKRCHRRLFQVIPEPRVRSCEVQDCLSRLVEPARRAVVQDLTELFEYHFPESTEPVTPRSLKHLSRVQVRHCLRERGCFIRDMLHLDLPRSIKRYVDLGLYRSKNPTVYMDTRVTDPSMRLYRCCRASSPLFDTIRGETDPVGYLRLE